jgi:hypothetical protein
MAKKDIFDLFREKSEELEQMPSPQAWARIESRMAAKRPSVSRPSRVRQLPRPLGIAAALALLLGLSVVFMWLSEQGQTGVLAHQQIPLELEELQIIVDDQSTSGVENAPSHLDITPAKPIVEGTASQKLVAKKESFREGGANPATRTDSIENENPRRTSR